LGIATAGAGIAFGLRSTQARCNTGDHLAAISKKLDRIEARLVTTTIPVLSPADFDEYLAAQEPKLAQGTPVFAHFVASVSPVTGHS
jgi:hypothetical protein